MPSGQLYRAAYSEPMAKKPVDHRLYLYCARTHQQYTKHNFQSPPLINKYTIQHRYLDIPTTQLVQFSWVHWTRRIYHRTTSPSLRFKPINLSRAPPAKRGKTREIPISTKSKTKRRATNISIVSLNLPHTPRTFTIKGSSGRVEHNQGEARRSSTSIHPIPTVIIDLIPLKR